MESSQNNQQFDEVKIRLHQFLESLDQLEPETANLQEIDRLIGMIDEMEEQMDKIKSNN